MPIKTTQTPLPTLADVADLAGVSSATVSRCLNAPDKVGQTTKDKVMSAINELGYSPNFGARALAAKRTNTIGAVIPTMDNAIFARGLQAFEEELNENGQTLLVASSNYDPDLEERQIRTLIARGADALLLIGYSRDPSIYEFLSRQGIPTVVSWAHDHTQMQPSVGFDNRAASHALATHVIGLGHRNIGYIAANTATNDRARDRVTGARDAMEQAGLDPQGLQIMETRYSITNGAEACGALLSQHPDITAIMCGNDVLAVGALRQAQKMGLDVPRDISITGFDDIEISMITEPELTTVHVPHRKMGRAAARYLIDTILSDTPPAPVAPLTTDLCLRGTLAAPKLRA